MAFNYINLWSATFRHCYIRNSKIIGSKQSFTKLNCFKLFQCTDNGKYLTNEQRQFYEDNGYLILRNLVDHDLIDQCRTRHYEVSVNGPTTSDMFVMKEHSLTHKNLSGEDVIKKIHNVAHDDVFFQLCSYKPLVDVVESIIGSSITCCASVMISKPPNAELNSSQHPSHQDLNYLPLEPINCVVTTWSATELTNKDNGGLYVHPGTHKGGLVRHKYGQDNKNVGYYQVADLPEIPPTYLTINKGDTLFIHPLLMHGSGPNYTQTFRRSILITYANSNCTFVDVRGTPREELGKIMYEGFKRKHQFLKSYMDAWKYRSRLIRGLPGSYQRYLTQL